MKHALPLALASQLTALPALGEQRPAPRLLVLLLQALPILFLIVIWIYIVKRVRLGDQLKYMPRAMEHMTRVEETLARIDANLKRLVEQADKDVKPVHPQSQPPPS